MFEGQRGLEITHKEEIDVSHMLDFETNQIEMTDKKQTVLSVFNNKVA